MFIETKFFFSLCQALMSGINLVTNVPGYTATQKKNAGMKHAHDSGMISGLNWWMPPALAADDEIAAAAPYLFPSSPPPPPVANMVDELDEYCMENGIQRPVYELGIAPSGYAQQQGFK